jgi:O-antigen/teichoic acid export membrane protein
MPNTIGLIFWYLQLLILIGVGAAIGVAVVGVGVAVYVSGRRKKTKLLMMLQESTVDLGIDLVCFGYLRLWVLHCGHFVLLWGS